MTFPGKGAMVSQVLSLTLECANCGRIRVRKPADLRRFGITGETPLSDVSCRLYCHACRQEGDDDRNITVRAAFASQLDLIRAEAQRISGREAPYAARRARGA